MLNQLRDEFPDITISKIRFLESQGLVEPERTPSGYRKFYPADVERLRFILRQQREHFLPLKVIKERLDELDRTAALPADRDTGAAAPTTPTRPSRRASRRGAGASGRRRSRRCSRRRARRASEAEARGRSAASRRRRAGPDDLGRVGNRA